MLGIYIILGIFIILGYFVQAELLKIVFQWRKATLLPYRHALAITVGERISAIIIATIFVILTQSVSVTIAAALIGSFFTFRWLCKKYNPNALGQFFGIYILWQLSITIVLLAIVLFARLFIVQPFYVKGAAMEPTFKDRDYLLINELKQNYSRGEVVVFHYPLDKNQYFIKRIIGLPGETIDVRGGQFTINQTALTEPYAQGALATMRPVVLGSEEYYVVGDNRTASRDSRHFGPIKKSDIVGSYFYRVPLK